MNPDLLQISFENSTTFAPDVILVQAIVLILLSSLMSIVYLFRGNSLSNRARIAAMLPLMALTTMLIISIVKSSLALSLGLVGALSIVRFRAAIKDPEELAYIFLAVALGLGFGADQAYMTTVFFVIIIVFILLQSLLRSGVGRIFTDKDALHLEVVFHKRQDLVEVCKLLDAHTTKIKLVRFDEGHEQVMRFLIKPKSTVSVDGISTSLRKLDAKAAVNFLQYQPLS